MTILPKQMTEQLSFEVDVKFVTKEEEQDNLFYLVRMINSYSPWHGS